MIQNTNTKYKHAAHTLFRKGKEAIGKKPTLPITDSLPAYHNAYTEFYTNKAPRTEHVSTIKVS
jgi:hypothetical protein